MGCGSSNQNTRQQNGNPHQIASGAATNHVTQPPQQPAVPPPQQHLQQQPPPQQQQKPLTKAALDKGTLVRYVEIEKEINRLEAMNVVQHLQIKWEELKSLEEEIRRLTAAYQSCQELALKEKKDIDNMQEPSVRQFFADQTSFNARISKEQEEHLTALNKLEVAQKAMDSAVAHRDSTRMEVKELHDQAESLQKLYKEQEVILSSIFDGKYGSDLEHRLEHEHDIICDKQQRISAAKARWQAARLLVQHGSSQLGYAVQRWDYICRIPVDEKTLSEETLKRNTQMRYSIATEVRNYLIAAGTNLRNSQSYLKGIQFPYCKIDEVVTLERATNNIYADLVSTDRHQHAMNVYRTMFQRSHALLQWFDLVINQTIERDFKNATDELFVKKRELRMERVRLIKEKLVELFGAAEAAAAGLDEDGNLTDARRLQEQLSKVNEEELKKQLENVKIIHPEKVQHADAGEAAAATDMPPPPKLEEDDGDEGAKQAKPEALALKDLAPPPSQDQLFGDIESIKKQYEIDMEEFNRAQDVNRTRVEQGLQEKLAARKSRKARTMAQQEQTEKLLQESAGA